MPELLRTDLFVTTAQKPADPLVERARVVAAELGAPCQDRREKSLPKLFDAMPTAQRAVVVQTDRLLLASREGHEFFYHPNMGFLRLGNLLRGGHDSLLDATGLGPGDSVLDCTLGYAAEAILCAYAVGETGTVHGIEGVPELGIVIREGLQTVVTDRAELNAAMRRIRVVHLGDHADYLRGCAEGCYDVVCFDPFFQDPPAGSGPFAPIRHFGDHTRLLRETLEEAKRVARRRVVVKAEKFATLLEELGISQRVEARHSKVVYGVVEVASPPLTAVPGS